MVNRSAESGGVVSEDLELEDTKTLKLTLKKERDRANVETRTRKQLERQLKNIELGIDPLAREFRVTSLINCIPAMFAAFKEGQTISEIAEEYKASPYEVEVVLRLGFRLFT